jgi:hypothetical protein
MTGQKKHTQTYKKRHKNLMNHVRILHTFKQLYIIIHESIHRHTGIQTHIEHVNAHGQPGHGLLKERNM